MWPTCSLCYAGLHFIPLFKSQQRANAGASRFKPWTHVGDSPPLHLTLPLGLTPGEISALHSQARCLAPSTPQPHSCHTAKAQLFQRRECFCLPTNFPDWMAGLSRHKSEYHFPMHAKASSLLTGVMGLVPTLPFSYLHHFSRSFQYCTLT